MQETFDDLLNFNLNKSNSFWVNHDIDKTIDKKIYSVLKLFNWCHYTRSCQGLSGTFILTLPLKQKILCLESLVSLNKIPSPEIYFIVYVLTGLARYKAKGKWQKLGAAKWYWGKCGTGQAFIITLRPGYRKVQWIV